MIKRYDVSAYCYRCGSAEGTGAVEVTYDEDKNGGWVGHHDHITSLNFTQQLKSEIIQIVERGIAETDVKSQGTANYLFRDILAKLTTTDLEKEL